MNSLEKMQQIQTATRKARQRTGNQNISTSVCSGKFLVNLAEPTKKGFYKITQLSEPLALAEAVKFLDEMN